jgi:nickel-dependent lactate racemase
MPTVDIPFEQGTLSMALPDGWQIVDTVRPLPHAKLADETAALIAALDHPIGTPPLRDKALAQKRIVLCVDDISRSTPTGRYFGALVDYLVSHGAVPANMLILFALGVHRDMTAEEARLKLGESNLHGIPWHNHSSTDERELIRLGTTTRGTHVSLNRHLVAADLIITLGAIEPHLLLGFSGGCKMIIPGLASAQTIAENHMQGVSHDLYNYIGIADSPMRLDLEEGAAMLGKEIFIINAVMNEALEVCAFFAGDPVKAHREGVHLVQSVSARPVDAPVDVVIVASNPMNADLRQGLKCIGNVEASVRHDGLIIGLLECRNGIGDIVLPSKSLPNGLIRWLLKIIGSKRVLGFIDRVKRGAGIEERFLAHFSMQLARNHQIFVHSRNLPVDTGKRVGLFVQFATVEAMLQAARRRAPKNARVLLYPYAGATYPVLTSADEPHPAETPVGD